MVIFFNVFYASTTYKDRRNYMYSIKLAKLNQYLHVSTRHLQLENHVFLFCLYNSTWPKLKSIKILSHHFILEKSKRIAQVGTFFIASHLGNIFVFKSVHFGNNFICLLLVVVEDVDLINFGHEVLHISMIIKVALELSHKKNPFYLGHHSGSCWWWQCFS